jgi:SNF2 family DNA or RNA helicase
LEKHRNSSQNETLNVLFFPLLSEINLHHSSFVNRISDFHQNEEPPQFYGGIIADPMGLGKTLTMIALAATNLDSDKDSGMHMYMDEDDKPYVLATLVIIPPPRELYRNSNIP